MGKIFGMLSGVAMVAGSAYCWRYWALPNNVAMLFALCGVMLVWRSIEQD